jgi:anti-anti-sigma factor
MSVDTKKSRNVTIPADLDAERTAGFHEEVTQVLRERPPEIAIDCSLLDHVASGHINALWDALTRCEEAGVPMRLTSVGYGLQRVLSVLDLADLFTVEEDEGRVRTARVDLGPPASRLFEVEFEAALEAVRDTLGRFRDFLSGFDLAETCAFDLETVFYEVSTNICRHSGLSMRGRVTFTADMNHDEIILRFTDSGAPFDPTGHAQEFDPHEAIKRRQRRGIGLVMINRLTDGITYERVGGRFNVVTLTRRLEPTRR